MHFWNPFVIRKLKTYVPGTEMSLVPKCLWYRNVPGTKMSWYRKVPVPKCLWGRNVLVPKCLWDRNVPVPKCPWYRNVPVPKCLWGRNVPGPKCTWYRNVPVPKCLWDRNVRTEMSHAEKSGTEMWNSQNLTIERTLSWLGHVTKCWEYQELLLVGLT